MLLSLNTVAAELNCALNIANQVQGVRTTPSGLLIISDDWQPDYSNYHTRFGTNLDIPSAVRDALVGNVLSISQVDYKTGTISQLLSEAIKNDTTRIQLSVDTPPLAAGRGKYVITLSGPFAEGPPAVRQVPIHSGLTATNIHAATYGIRADGARDEINSNLSIISTWKDTDAISFPDKINLGPLIAGKNNNENLVDYRLNSNNIGITFSVNTTEGASFTVNDKLSESGVLYTPPLRLGMFVSPNAPPGTYTSTVNARWTCP